MNYFEKRINFFVHINLGIEIFYVFMKRLKENSFKPSRIDELIQSYIEEIFKSKKILSILETKQIIPRKDFYTFFWNVFKNLGIIDKNSFKKLFEISFLVLKKNLMYLNRVEEINLITENHFKGLFLNYRKDFMLDSIVDSYKEVRKKII